MPKDKLKPVTRKCRPCRGTGRDPAAPKREPFVQVDDFLADACKECQGAGEIITCPACGSNQTPEDVTDGLECCEPQRERNISNAK
jgi:DnaJ-class molecular chaperone